MTLYYALFYPHITYGITVWGSACKSQLSPLATIQNKIVKIIGSGAWRDHATPYYKKLNILKLEDVHKLEVGKLMFKNDKNTLPESFTNFFTETHSVHSHNTRASSRKDLAVPRFATNCLQQSIKYQGVTIWNAIPLEIKRTSFATFKKKYKKSLLDLY